MVTEEIKLKKKKEKSLSQTLRSVIFLYWKQSNTNDGFDMFYDKHINAIIDQYKSKIKDTP